MSKNIKDTFRNVGNDKFYIIVTALLFLVLVLNYFWPAVFFVYISMVLLILDFVIIGSFFFKRKKDKNNG
ncbi:MAG: hypothetical protein RR565_05450 [Erysipelothrix sp.]